MSRYATVYVHEECGATVEARGLPATRLDPAEEHLHCPACGREVSEEECYQALRQIPTREDFRHID